VNNSDELLILSILTNSLGCDLNDACNWLEAMDDRLTSWANLDQLETIEELERFVLDFVADYKEEKA
jgi:hypothetical protein